jgi:Mrp family chromosome partitioning ATPase
VGVLDADIYRPSQPMLRRHRRPAGIEGRQDARAARSYGLQAIVGT